MTTRLLAAGLLALAVAPLARGDADTDWERLVALDAGPKKQPASRDEAVALARQHLQTQRQAVERFLAAYPNDPRAFDASARLAALLAAQGMMDSKPKQVQEAASLLAKLEATPGIPHEKRADVAFQRVSLFMQTQRDATARMRDALVSAARGYVAKYPGDRRGPRLLVEVATICDESPGLKRKLLEEASRLTNEDPLRRRIDDDLKRLDRLGKPLALSLATLDGGRLDLASLHGNIVVLIFWSAESPHSRIWLQGFRSAWDKLPKKNVRVVTVSLDNDRSAVVETLNQLRVDWPTHFDGKGWESPLARPLGINALPTVWILDRKGVLSTLNARENYDTIIQQLLRE